jgi:hypothetical protein
MTHNVTKLPQVKDNNASQFFLVKPTEDICEAYFAQHVLNVTLRRCQIYSALSSAYNGVIPSFVKSPYFFHIKLLGHPQKIFPTG